MDKQNVVHPYKAIPLKKKYDTQTSVSVNTDDSQSSLFKQILSSTWEKSQAPSEEDNILEEKA